MGYYAADGSMNVTVVAGSSYTGLHAADGSINVILAPGGSYVGAYHPCGAYYVTVAPAAPTRPNPIKAPDGSMNVSETPYTNGGQRVTVVSGSLSGFTPTSAQSAAFLTRATGITVLQDKQRYDALITGLVTDSLYAKLDVLYIFAAPDSTTALLNLIQNNFNGTVVGALTFNQYVGYTGTGATNYINTGFNPSTAAGNYSQNSGTLGLYILNNRVTDQGYVGVGTASGAGFSFIAPQNATAVTKYSINTASPKNVASATARGQLIATRTGAGATALQRNGAALDTDTAASVAIDNTNMYMFAYNTGVPSAFSLDQHSAALIGGGLTGPEMVSLAARINTFMTAYGIAVY